MNSMERESGGEEGGLSLIPVSHSKMAEMLNQVTDPVRINDTVNALAAALDQCYQLFAIRTGRQLGVGCMVSARNGRRQRELMAQLDDFMFRLRNEAGVERVVTGGGPFCMERCATCAVNNGMEAVEVELNLPSEHEHRNGGYKSVKMPRHNFDPRIMTMLAQCDIVFGLDPYGVGTAYEIFAAIQRNQAQESFGDDNGVPHVPRYYSGVRLPQQVICIGPKWTLLRQMMRSMKDEGTVGEEELSFLHFVDTLDEGADIAVEFSTRWRERAKAIFGDDLVSDPPGTFN
ncbi:MAG: hypothetical protein KDD64_10015 [Bdellovibrionales bacterium]|nr:hypothetical protein [Bdellovibrionales bacterium]